MYAVYAYIGVVWGVNVGIYGIHGVSGKGDWVMFPPRRVTKYLDHSWVQVGSVCAYRRTRLRQQVRQHV